MRKRRITFVMEVSDRRMLAGRALMLVLRGLRIRIQLGGFDIHVLEFAGFEDFATFFTFDEFGIFLARYDLYARVLARIRSLLR